MTATATTTTPAVDRLVALATAAGLRPSTTVSSYRGAREINLDSGRRYGAFGVLRVGVRTGRFIAGSVTLGNAGATVYLNGFAEARELLAELAAGRYALTFPAGPDGGTVVELRDEPAA